MKTSDFYFDLPEELIAQKPAGVRGEDRLMLLGRDDGHVEHHQMAELVDLVSPGTLMVFNNSKVRRSRCYGIKTDTGREQEFMFLNQTGPDGCTWNCMVKGAKKVKAGNSYRFPDGRVFEPFYTYSRRDYVVIVATDEAGNYICVRQYRHGIKRVTTEFCAGGIERSDGKEYGNRSDVASAEDALEAAKRELMEETGYESDDWKFLLSVPSNATMADNYANIFVAKNCRNVSGQSLDETEFLNVHLYTREEIDHMISSGEFPQASHILALLLADKNE